MTSRNDLSFFRMWYSLSSGANKCPEEHITDIDVEAQDILAPYLARRSWFDKITTWWVDKSPFVKMIYMSAITISAALIGAIVGAPFILALSILFFSFVLHRLFASHESNRREAALALAKDTIELNKRFTKGEELLKKTQSELGIEAEILKDTVIRHNAAVVEIGPEISSLGQGNNVLKPIPLHVEGAMVRFIQNTDLKIADGTEHFEQEIKQETRQLVATGQEVVQASHDFSNAVKRFGIFVDKQQTHASSNKNGNDFIAQCRQEQAHTSRFLVSHNQILAEMDAFIAGYNPRGSVSCH